MKLSIPFLVIALFLSFCGQKPQQQEESEKEVQAEVAEPSFDALLTAVESGDPIPSMFIESLLQEGGSSEAYLEILSESGAFVAGKLVRTTGDKVDVFLATFSKPEGTLSSFELIGSYRADDPYKGDIYSVGIGGSEADEIYMVSNRNEPDWSAEYRISEAGLIDGQTAAEAKVIASDFLDFIKKLKAGGDLMQYQEEPYYEAFLTRNYSGPINYNHLVASDQYQVFRAMWGEVEVDVDHIWVFDNQGKLLSDCDGLPSGDVGMIIRGVTIDTVSLEPIILDFRVARTAYEVIETEEMPERGELIGEEESTFRLTVKDGKCRLEEL